MPDKEVGENKHLEIQVEVSFNENPTEAEKITNNQVVGNVYRQLGTWLESEDGRLPVI
ncbi:MAG: hypothetical protein K5894_12035 [Lachnospiraceae bacterium]|nr:hypothetical protein [Lachnospiraceae bacterium]